MIGERDVVARVDSLTVRRLRSWVRRGWVQPAIKGKAHTFTDVDVARVQLICELREDLRINEDAIPVVLSLMDQVYGLRHQLRSLAEAIEGLPPAMRRDLTARLRERRNR
jgi:chaperone modulatory protein CbpM